MGMYVFAKNNMITQEKKTQQFSIMLASIIFVTVTITAITLQIIKDRKDYKSYHKKPRY
jgi:hypothetical protein